MGSKKRVAITLLLSVIIHLVLLYFLAPNSSQVPQKKRQLHLSLLKRKILKQKRIPPKKRVKKEPQKVKPKQIVDIKKPLLKRKPQKAKYLAKYDQHVKKQTKVKSTNRRSRGRAPAKRSPRKQRTKIAKQLPKPLKKEQKKKISQKKNPKVIHHTEKNAQLFKKPEKKSSKEIKKQSSHRPFKIQYNFEKFSQITEKAASNDHLPDVAKGEILSLETLAFEYADYYLKIKRKLSKEWSPAAIYQRYDPYRKVYGVKDRYTVLKVSIDQTGYLKEIKLRKSCGLKFLDKEAIRAFESAQPFKTVPKPLVAKKGYFTILFGFYVDNPDSPSIFYIKK